jgi:hypothetical protein
MRKSLRHLANTRVHGPFSVFRAGGSATPRPTARPKPASNQPPPPVAASTPAEEEETPAQELCWPLTIDFAGTSLEPPSKTIPTTQDSLGGIWTALGVDYTWPDAQFAPGSPIFPSVGDLFPTEGLFEDSFEAPNENSLSEPVLGTQSPA